MEILGITVKNERDIKISVRNLPGTVQVCFKYCAMFSLSNFRIKFCLSLKEPETTHSETGEWKIAIPANGGKRSDARSEHICGRTSTFLYSEYRTALKISEISRPTRRIYASTSEPTCEM